MDEADLGSAASTAGSISRPLDRSSHRRARRPFDSSPRHLDSLDRSSPADVRAGHSPPHRAKSRCRCETDRRCTSSAKTRSIQQWLVGVWSKNYIEV